MIFKKFLLIIFCCLAQISFSSTDFIVLHTKDTIWGKIKLTGLTESLQFVEILSNDSVFKLTSSEVSFYNRQEFKVQTFSVIQSDTILKRFEHEMENGLTFQMYAFWDRGEIKYRLIRKKDFKEVTLTEKNFKRILPRWYRHKPNVREVLKDNNCIENIGKLVEFGNSSNWDIDVDEDIIKRRNNKIPIYKGKKGNEKSSRYFINKVLGFNNVYTNNNSNPESEISNNGKNEGESGRNGRKDNGGSGGGTNGSNEQVLYFNFGINTGLETAINPFLGSVVPSGINIGMDSDVGFFTDALRFGYTFNYTYMPYVSKGNASNKNIGPYIKLVLGETFYFKTAYVWNRFRFNQYLGKNLECSNIKDPNSGLYDGGKFLGALRIMESRENGFYFSLGVNTESTVWSIFNNFEIGYAYIPINQKINQKNASHASEINGRDYSQFNETMHVISLKIGLYSR